MAVLYAHPQIYRGRMDLKHHPNIEITEDLVAAIRSFPTERQVEHCGTTSTVSPFDFYATCSHCDSSIKVRSFSSGHEIEDVFDAFFEWMKQPGAKEVADRRWLVTDEDS